MGCDVKKATEEEINYLLDSGEIVNLYEQGLKYYEAPGLHWLAVYKDDDIIGMAFAGDKTNASIELHIGVLSQYKRDARKLARSVLDYIWCNMQDIYHICTYVPFCYPEVKNFVIKCGFQVDCVERQSIYVNGELTNRWILSICRGL